MRGASLAAKVAAAEASERLVYPGDGSGPCEICRCRQGMEALSLECFVGDLCGRGSRKSGRAVCSMTTDGRFRKLQARDDEGLAFVVFCDVTALEDFQAEHALGDKAERGLVFTGEEPYAGSSGVWYRGLRGGVAPSSRRKPRRRGGLIGGRTAAGLDDFDEVFAFGEEEALREGAGSPIPILCDGPTAGRGWPRTCRRPSRRRSCRRRRLPEWLRRTGNRCPACGEAEDEVAFSGAVAVVEEIVGGVMRGSARTCSQPGTRWQSR